MEEPIRITWLNDFVFCPASIYFHNLYGDADRLSFQEPAQINGTHAHEKIDNGGRSAGGSVLSGISVYSEQYGLIGKIDIYHMPTGTLTERKKKINTVYDGYIFQLYGQCFALREAGYTVKRLVLHSLEDNKNYPVALPENDPETLEKFRRLVAQLRGFRMQSFRQSNAAKCARCIYEPLCDCALPAQGGKENAQ